jgi:hypothetical protein
MTKYNRKRSFRALDVDHSNHNPHIKGTNHLIDKKQQITTEKEA